jgi:putative ABC transport system ATP-binding protein
MTTPAPAPILRVENLHKDYRLGKTIIHALRGVSFTVARGDFISIVGPSGCGKTTLLNIVGCIDKPTSGSILLDGMDISTFDDDREADTRLEKIGFIFQSFNLVGVLDVRENIEYPLVLAGMPKKERALRVARLIEEVGLGEYVDHRPDELSGGQRQRVAIARALANGPSLIIADEPTANLDSDTAMVIMEAMRRLNEEEGVSFIFSTHNELIERYAKRVLHMKDGLITGERATSPGASAPVRTAAAPAAARDPAEIGGRP